MILIIILSILSIPFLLLFGFFHLVINGLENLGLAPELVLVMFVAMLIGSFINIPLTRRRLIEVETSRFFGLFKRKGLVAQGLSLNVGGALIPILLASYLLFQVPLQPTLIATGLMIILSFKMARVIPGKGIVMPFLIPPLFAVVIAFMLAPNDTAMVAFTSGVFGVLIGADLLNVPKIMREQSGILSIGGAGVFDGIFLIGIISALLAGL